MDFSKLRLGELVAGACGVLLLIDMFFSWYGIGGSLGGGLVAQAAKAAGVDTTVNAWQAFGFTDILLFIACVVAIGAAVLTAQQRSVALPVAASVLVAAIGAFVTVIVLYRIINQPGPNNLVDVKFGAYLGLLLCAGIALGGFMSMRDEGTSFGEAAKQVQGGGTRAAAPPPAAPPPAAPPPAAPPAPADEQQGGPPPSAPPPGA